MKNATNKDGGIWKFVIGAIYGKNYKELEYNHEVVISNEGKKRLKVLFLSPCSFMVSRLAQIFIK